MNNRYYSLDEIMSSDLFNQITTPVKKLPKVHYDPEIEKFQEIVVFVQEHGREPKKGLDLSERSLASRLIGIRKDPKRIEYLKPYDEVGILETNEEKEVEIPKISSIDDILNSGSSALLGGSNDVKSIFDTTRIKKIENKPDYVAKRKKVEDFNQYEPIFKKIHKELAEGIRQIVPFSNYDIKEGSFFILKGVLLYVKSIGEYFRTEDDKDNARMHVIFENGTESDMLLRSLAADLYKKGKMVTDNVENVLFGVNEDDVATGFIYVLRSLSADPQISSIKDLYKIGHTGGEVEKRISGAENESTYLYAPVEIVTTYQVFNLDANKFETAIHHALAGKQLDVSIVGPNGKLIVPKEWFVVSLDEVTKIIQDIIIMINM